MLTSKSITPEFDFVKMLPKVGSVLASGVGILVLLGWASDLSLLKTIHSGFSPMKANTAVAFIFLGVSLWISLLPSSSRFLKWTGSAAAGITAAIAVISLAQYVFKINLGIDLIFFKEASIAAGGTYPGRMGSTTAINFILMTGAVLLLDAPAGSISRFVSPALATLAAAVALFALVGYAYSNSFIVPSNRMAVHTAILFQVLSASVLAACSRRVQTPGILRSAAAGVKVESKSLEKMIGATFGVGLLFMVVIGVISGRSIHQFVASAEDVIRTHKVLLSLDDLLIDLLNVETGHRGYVISGEDRYLEPFRLGVAKVEGNVEKLRGLIRDPEQLKELAILEPLVTRLVSSAKERTEIREKQGFEAAVPLIDEGKRVMDEIRAEMARMKENYERKLQQRVEATQVRANDAIRIISFGSFLAFLMVGGASFFINRDIVKRREAEAERERFFTLSLDMLCIAGADGYFKRLNPSFTKTLGWTVEEMLAKPLLEFIHPDDREATLQEIERQVVRGEMVLQFENRYLHKNGTYRLLSWKSVPQGKTLMYATARDVTDLRLAEEELRRRAAQIEEANKELEAFSYSVSHDLRAPLRHIDGFVDLLQKNSGALEDKAKRYLGIIADSAKQMGRLIDDLLVFSRMGRTEMRRGKVQLSMIVKDTLDDLKEDYKDRQIEWKIGALPEIEGDVAMLRLVFQNLISNAIKYTGTREKASIEIGAMKHKDENIVFVRDNGVGFDAQYSAKLFNVFQRLHSSDEFEGTGIGLANVRRIISRHGGRTWAEGVLNEGATFYISIPTLN